MSRAPTHEPPHERRRPPHERRRPRPHEPTKSSDTPWQVPLRGTSATIPPPTRDRRRRPRPTAGDTAESRRPGTGRRDADGTARERRDGRAGRRESGRRGRRAAPARGRWDGCGRVGGEGAGGCRRPGAAGSHTMHAVLGASLAAVIGTSKPTLVDVDHDALMTTRPPSSTSNLEHADALAPAGCCRRVLSRPRPRSPVARGLTSWSTDYAASFLELPGPGR
jgi:hypothetical protein